MIYRLVQHVTDDDDWDDDTVAEFTTLADLEAWVTAIPWSIQRAEPSAPGATDFTPLSGPKPGWTGCSTSSLPLVLGPVFAAPPPRYACFLGADGQPSVMSFNTQQDAERYVASVGVSDKLRLLKYDIETEDE